MSRCAIMVDSACAPTQDIMTRPDVFRMGMNINLDGSTYVDGENLEPENYYASIDRVRDFSTTPPLVWDIKKQYENIRRKGFDSVISIHVSSKMSKLVETCENASHMVSGLDVKIVDTRNLSIGSYFIVEKIAELSAAGKQFDEIEQLLPEIRKSSFLQISLSTLKYLIKNKRVGRVQGMVGNIMKVKPILGIDDEGYLTTLAKERGGARVAQKICESAIDFIERHPHNVKFYLTWGFDKNKLQAEQVFEKFMVEFQKLGIRHVALYKNRMWPTIACNSGPGAYGIGIYGEEYPID